MTTIPQILADSRTAMDKAVESSRREFTSIRTGKASAALLDTVRVDAYGQSMPINQLASVAAPEPRLLTVTPWDKGQIQAIEKAIRESDLGLNPSTQGGLIRVPLPQLSITRSGTNVILTWQASFSAFHLQSTVNLVPTNWTNASPPAMLVGGQETVTNAITGSRMFYRLSQ